MMQRFARWHIWLGWIVAIPMLLWVISGLVMAVRPIDEVRGEHLRREAGPVPPGLVAFPQLSQPIARANLTMELGRPVWIITGADKRQGRFSATDGAPLGPVNANEARQLAEAAFAGDAALEAIRRFPADNPPLDLRRPRPSWQASFADGTHLYIDADTGEVLALRTRFWRFYDLFWGFHIVDPMERENAHNPWLLGLAGLALVSSIFGTVLLFRRRKTRPAG